MTEAEKRELAELKARGTALEKNFATLSGAVRPLTQPIKAPIRRG